MQPSHNWVPRIPSLAPFLTPVEAYISYTYKKRCCKLDWSGREGRYFGSYPPSLATTSQGFSYCRQTPPFFRRPWPGSSESILLSLSVHHMTTSVTAGRETHDAQTGVGLPYSPALALSSDPATENLAMREPSAPSRSGRPRLLKTPRRPSFCDT